MIGSFCFAPLALMLPAAAWLFQFGKAYWHNGGIVQKSYVVLNVLLFLLGVFVFGPGSESCSTLFNTPINAVCSIHECAGHHQCVRRRHGWLSFQLRGQQWRYRLRYRESVMIASVEKLESSGAVEQQCQTCWVAPFDRQRSEEDGQGL